jgi:hypothetical protein
MWKITISGNGSGLSELCDVIWEGGVRGDKAMYSCNIIAFSEYFGI